MKSVKKREVIWRWSVGLIVAGVFVVVAGRWFYAPAPIDATAPAAPKAGAVNLMRVAGGEISLLDKEPLFLPTEWNTTQKDVRQPETTGALSSYPPKLTFTESELKLSLPLPVDAPSSAAEALAISPLGALFAGLGRGDGEVKPLERRGAFLEVSIAATGRKILGEPLLGSHAPARASWQPLEFLAAIDAGGLVSLDLTVRSGAEEVDVYFSHYLAETLRIGSRLTPGFYRICVGP